ncbi:MAG: hypothetical protein A3A72_03835, partial [Deltaproteobacteria bacterium RIFCSPLOWO2_01_FULL_38_9]
YAKLAKIYGELEKTAKRLEKTYVLSEFLKGTKEDDVKAIVLLLQGRLFPHWDTREIGVASKIVIKAISKATGISAAQIENEWRRKGDLGIVTEEFIGKKKQATLVTHELTVAKVFENLRKLAGLEGIGTVEKKISLIAELLTSAKPAEAKYITRTVLGDLRIGVGEGSLRDAIVWAFFGDKIGVKYNKEEKNIDVEDRAEYNRYADAVQNAYDITNDFSAVAESAKKGLKGLGETALSVGKPVKVMLALKVNDIKDGFERCGKPAEFEYKLDGFRCVSGFTPVYIKNKGIVVIRDVKVGDYVLTHNGEYKRVIAKNVRKIDKDEKIFRFQTFLGNEFKITEKHKIWIWKNNKPLWVAIEKVKMNDEVVFPMINLEVKKLPKSMILSTTDMYKKKISLNKNFFRFLGYWIGDGYTNTNNDTYRVGLIFNKKDKKLLKFYKTLVMGELGITSISESQYKGVICLYWTDRPLLKWLSQNFRNNLKEGWKGKTLPFWFLGISKENFIEFLKGWIEADGHTDKFNRTSVITKESSLATLSQLIALKFSIILGLKRIRIYGKTYFKLIIVKSKREARIYGNKLIIKILKLEELRRKYPRGIDPRTLVYNLQVEKDKSYCTTLIALHNCQIHKKGKDITIFTRRLENVTKQFPEVVEFIKKNVKGDEFIIDSEAVGYDPKTGKYMPFQNVSQRIKRKYDIADMARKLPVELNIFDILYYDGKNLLNEDFEKRRELLEKIVRQKKKEIVLAKKLVTSDEKEVEKFYKEALNSGNEGLMVKNLHSPYKPGARVNHMVKLKPTMENLDLVIVGAEWGTGKRATWLSSFSLACFDN